MTILEAVCSNRISYLQKQNEELAAKAKGERQIRLEVEERLDRQKATIIRQRDTIEALYKENNLLRDTRDNMQNAYDVVCGYNNQQSETIIDLKEKLENQRSVSEVLIGARDREIVRLTHRLQDVERDRDAFEASNRGRGENIANLEKQNIEYELALRAMSRDRDFYKDCHRISLERIFNYEAQIDRGCPSCGYGKKVNF